MVMLIYDNTGYIKHSNVRVKAYFELQNLS